MNTQNQAHLFKILWMVFPYIIYTDIYIWQGNMLPFCRLATNPSNDPWHANCHEFTVAGLHSAGGEWILRACFVGMALAQPLM